MKRPFSISFAAILLVGLLFQGCSSGSKTAGTGKPDSRKLRQRYAKKLGVSPKDVDPLKLYRFVDEWRGTDYRLGGQSKNGVDCSGLTRLLYGRVYEVNLPRRTEAIYEKASSITDKKALREGDLVFFKTRGKKSVNHVGVYLRNGRFVHASSSSGVIISRLGNPYYQKTFSAGGRMNRLGDR